MNSVGEAFIAPFNWCDRRCERCPLDPECAVRKRERQRRWVAEARGLDPDDPAVVMAEMNYDLDFMLRMLEEVAAEEGLDLSEPLPPRVSVLDVKRLERASMVIVKCVTELAHAKDPRLEACVRELRSLTMTLATKSARLGHFLEDGGPYETWDTDAIPNLLLLERLKRETRQLFAGVSELGHADERAPQALAELDRLLDPLIAEIGAAPRALLAALEARSAAPSPFVQVGTEKPPATEPAALAASAKPHLKLLR